MTDGPPRPQHPDRGSTLPPPESAAGNTALDGGLPGEPEHSPTERSDRAAVWGAFLASLALAGAFPLLEAATGRLAGRKRPALPEAPWIELLPTLGAALVIVVWVYVFWSLIGSFLNVVVYRLPRAASVVTGGSRCPTCDRPILWHDNLPIVGWLRLHGRCRACGLPIAPRYPVVEAVTAGLGTALYFRELVSGGANLPVRPADFAPGGLLRLLPDPHVDLLCLFLYHAAAICVLLAWGLVAWDRRRVPPRASRKVVLAAAAAALALPWLHPVGPGRLDGTVEAATSFVSRLLVPCLGGLAGLACGRGLESLLGRLLRGDAAGRTGLPFPQPVSLGFGLALVGVVCGWQGMLGTAVLLLAACLLQVLVWSALATWPAVPVELLLVPAAFIHLCWWRQLMAGLGRWWPAAPTPACLALPVALLVAVAAALLAIAPQAGGRGHRADPANDTPA